MRHHLYKDHLPARPAGRHFVEAQMDQPEQATEALQRIAKLYSHEETIKTKRLTGVKKRQSRSEHSQP